MSNKILRLLLLLISLMIVNMSVLAGCSSVNTGNEKLPVEQQPVDQTPVEQAQHGEKPEEAAKDQGTINRRPLAVMIENAPEARPQSGLDKADVVYEILAEGAITRFLAIYLHGEAEKIGPVRSSRPYYIERMLEYDAVYAYCGGSEAAKDMVRKEKVAALDEFGLGSPAYWRTKDRKAPHNLYTNTAKLRELAVKRGYEKQVKIPAFEFLGEGEKNKGGKAADNLIINYMRSYSMVWWRYDDAQKTYQRFQAGNPHRDAVTGEQLAASNILVQYTNTKVIDSVGRLQVDMTGRGEAVMFTGGQVYSGSWVKESLRKETIFYSEDGSVFKLNPGQTWIQVVPQYAKVEWSVQRSNKQVSKK